MNQDQFNSAMERIGLKFVEIIQQSLSQTYPYARGYSRQRQEQGAAPKIASQSLYNSVEAVWNPTTQELGIMMLDYWKWVDQGRSPGTYVPIKPLVEWATLRGFPEPERAAFGISTNIKKYGIEGTQFFSMVAADKIIELFETELTELYGITINQFFESLNIAGE